MKFLAFLRLARLKFLAGGFLLYALGAAVALYDGASLHGMAYLLGQVAVTCTQLMTHFANDYFDLEADRANRTPTRWSGGSRVLPAGELAPQVALIASLVCGGLATVAGLVLSFVVGAGALTLPLLGVAMALAWSYSAPPLRLTSTGFGELSTALVVPVMTPLMAYYLQAGRLALLPLLAALPLACLQFAMLLAIEFPDAKGDSAAGKRTLLVRVGASKAAQLYVLALVLVYGVPVLLVVLGLPALVAGAVLATFPLALWQIYRFRRSDWMQPAAWDSLAFGSVALLVTCTAVELAAFLHLWS